MKKSLLILVSLVFVAFSIQAQDHIITASGLSFSPNTLTINVGETVQWQNTSGSHNVNGSLATYPSNPEGFFSGSAAPAPWTFEHTFTIPGTYQYRCDPHFSAGMTGTITVIEPIPQYDIATITTVDADGVADSLDVVCQLQGLVYGIDFRAGDGIQFIMRDNTGGITVFDFDINYYDVTEGDEIIVQGTINQYNGLIQIDPDTIILTSNGNTLEDPVVVTTLDETTENELVRINGLSLVNPSQWGSGTSGYNVDMTDGVNTYRIRIDDECDLFGKPAPDNTFDVIGLGQQFDGSFPYISGYQLFPRYTSDLVGANFPGQSTYPVYDIAVVTTVDANGDLDSLGVKCELKGIVHSVNFSDLDLLFYFQDNTGGTSFFQSGNSSGYTVTPGDEIVVRGTIDTYNCLSEIVADTFWVESTGNDLFDPLIVIGPLTEEHEGEFIQINNLSLVDPTDWTTGTGNSGFTADATDGVNTYQIRIDKDVTDLYNSPAPTGTFNVLGSGGQFSSSNCNAGYQILPRSVEDIIPAGVTDRLIDLPIRVYPNPADQQLFVKTDVAVEVWIVYDLFGKQLLRWEGTPANGFDISSLRPGVYLLQANAEGKIGSRKFVVE